MRKCDCGNICTKRSDNTNKYTTKCKKCWAKYWHDKRCTDEYRAKRRAKGYKLNEKGLARHRKYDLIDSKNLNDRYVIKLLRNEGFRSFPKELIESKRLSVRLYRLINKQGG